MTSKTIMLLNAAGFLQWRSSFWHSVFVKEYACHDQPSQLCAAMQADLICYAKSDHCPGCRWQASAAVH